MTLTLNGSLLLVGAGKMGGAMLTGWLNDGLAASNVLVLDPSPSAEMRAWLSQQGISILGDTRELTKKAAPPQIIVMAVKPQIMDAAFAPVAMLAGPQTLVLSIAAGRSIASLAAHLPAHTPIIRAMPNTPAAIGRGITVCCGNEAVTTEQRARCNQLMSAVGDVDWVSDEALIDPVTALSGSGPAYVFLLAETMAQAGVSAGLDDALAMRLARATIAGAGELMRRSGDAPAVLRKNVTSPGGTTAAALDVLMGTDGDGSNLQELMTKAIAAATARGRDLSS